MRLSDQPEYRVAIPASHSGDFATARANLETLVSRARSEGDIQTASYLLQVLGDVEARAGNIELAHSLHKEGLALDPGSPLPLLHYAKGLLRAFKRPDLALSRLAEAEALLTSGNWRPGESEMSRDWYETEFNELRNEIVRQKP